MGKIQKPLPVKLIVGFIYRNETSLRKALGNLKKRFGSIDYSSRTLSFDYTDYYAKEMGKGLKRKFISFKKLILPQEISAIKIAANKIERRLCRNGKRTVNIDPGYLESSKLVLATTKDFNHRIYLKNGIYSEVTLTYKNKSFQPYEWTYPDYRSKAYIAILNKIRGMYASQIKAQ